MKISVVMPVWNEEALVGRAVDSILCQTEPDFELLIVDDGSTDATPRILADVAARDSRVRILNTDHGGIVQALQTGVATASGRYLARMDADDISLPDRLRLQADFLDRHPESGLVSCLVDYGGNPRENRGLALYVDWVNSLVSKDDIRRARFIESPIIHPSVMFRKELITRHGGYREGLFPEDYDLWLRWMDAGVSMGKVFEKLLVWNERENRLTRTDPRCSTDAFYSCKSYWLARWLEQNNPFHPDLFVWGAGRTSRKRLRFLKDHGIRVTAFVDVDLGKIGNCYDNIPVIAPEAIPAPGKCFVASYVGNRGARALIEEWFVERGYANERDFILSA